MQNLVSHFLMSHYAHSIILISYLLTMCYHWITITPSASQVRLNLVTTHRHYLRHYPPSGFNHCWWLRWCILNVTVFVKFIYCYLVRKNIFKFFYLFFGRLFGFKDRWWNKMASNFEIGRLSLCAVIKHLFSLQHASRNGE